MINVFTQSKVRRLKQQKQISRACCLCRIVEQTAGKLTLTLNWCMCLSNLCKFQVLLHLSLSLSLASPVTSVHSHRSVLPFGTSTDTFSANQVAKFKFNKHTVNTKSVYINYSTIRCLFGIYDAYTVPPYMFCSFDLNISLETATAPNNRAKTLYTHVKCVKFIWSAYGELSWR